MLNDRTIVGLDVHAMATQAVVFELATGGADVSAGGRTAERDSRVICEGSQESARDL